MNKKLVITYLSSIISIILLTSAFYSYVIANYRFVLLQDQVTRIANDINHLLISKQRFLQKNNLNIIREKELEERKKIIAEQLRYPIFISHRGYNAVYPEESMLAFVGAVEDGFTELEMDVYFTADNVPVLSHDIDISNLARDSDGQTVASQNITELTLEELYKYDFGIYKGEEFRGTRITTLEEVFEYVQKVSDVEMLHVELKTPTRPEQKQLLVDLVDKYELRNKVGWQSFIWTELSGFDVIAPDMQLELLGMDYSQEMYDNARKLDNGKRQIILSLSHSATSLRDAVATGYDTYIWTIDDFETMTLFKDSGVKGVMTNNSKKLEVTIKSTELLTEFSRLSSELDNLQKDRVHLEKDSNELDLVIQQLREEFAEKSNSLVKINE